MYLAARLPAVQGGGDSPHSQPCSDREAVRGVPRQPHYESEAVRGIPRQPRYGNEAAGGIPPTLSLVVVVGLGFIVSRGVHPSQTYVLLFEMCMKTTCSE